MSYPCSYVLMSYTCSYVLMSYTCPYVLMSYIRPSGYLEQGPRLSAKSAGTKNFHCLKCRNHIMPFTHQSLNPTHRTLKYRPKYRDVYFFLSSF